MSSLFENKIKEKSSIPILLPTDDKINTEIDNKPQEIKITEPQMSGAFFIVEGKLIADIRLEFNVEHPKYKEYFIKLNKFVKEAEKEHVLKSSSGI